MMARLFFFIFFFSLVHVVLPAESEEEDEIKAWRKLLKKNPRSTQVHVQLGLREVVSPHYHYKEHGIKLLERTLYDTKYVDDPVVGSSRQVFAALIGRWRWEQRNWRAARFYYQMAIQDDTLDPSIHLCVSVSLATMLDPFPRSLQAADWSVQAMLNASAELLHEITKFGLKLDEESLSLKIPGVEPDPYAHCVSTLFHLSFYYRADVARVATAHVQIVQALWPQLAHVSPNAVQPHRSSSSKIHLGVASACIWQGHSVTEDFKGVLRRLDRNKFQITYIYIMEKDEPLDAFVYDHPQDRIVLLRKQESDIRNGAWVTRHHAMIEKLQLDILFYLDLTMSTHAQRLAMAKLAPVQVVSHGHPVTSGVAAVDYYVSWAAAELDYDIAKTHYSEELILLPAHAMHQYYERRSNATTSRMNGQNFVDMVKAGRRSSFGMIPSQGHWYLCMQQPFKFHPEMDRLICRLLRQDLDAQIILRKEETAVNTKIWQDRLQQQGCDLERLHFLPQQEHHHLLALYKLSDVILDSYPAGGCTTSREVLELSKPIVTWPARLLGGRWTYAYYTMMGDATLNEMVIADSADKYVELAVLLGTNATRRALVEKRIQKNLPKLYRRDDSVVAWEKVWLDIYSKHFEG